jgi:hypothetical protein
MVGTADKRAASHFCKTHMKSPLSPSIEFFRRNEAFHREVFPGRLKILTQCEDAATHMKKIQECLVDLLTRSLTRIKS